MYNLSKCKTLFIGTKVFTETNFLKFKASVFYKCAMAKQDKNILEMSKNVTEIACYNVVYDLISKSLCKIV